MKSIFTGILLPILTVCPAWMKAGNICTADPRIYTRTHTITINEINCVMHITTFFYDPGTVENVNDDRILGVDHILDCDHEHQLQDGGEKNNPSMIPAEGPLSPQQFKQLYTPHQTP